MIKDKTQLLLENSDVFNETFNEFSTKPYDLASINEIIKRSSFNKGSFYYRFKDKNDLYISAIDYLFVQQIDLFKKTGFSLVSESNLKEILFSLFNNLIDLYTLDPRYYNFLHFYMNEQNDFIDVSNDLSIGSLYQRFMMKLSKNGLVTPTQLFIVQSVYKNFPIQEVISNRLELNSLINQVIGQDSLEATKLPEDSSNFTSLVEQNAVQAVNYYLVDTSKMELSNSWVDLIKLSRSKNRIIRRLRKSSLSFKFDIKKVLNRLKNKPIFNRIEVENLLEKDVYAPIVDDPVLYPILLSLVYSIIELKEYVVLDSCLDTLTDPQKDLLLNRVFAINGKLTKILIFDKVLVFNHNNLDQFYYLNHFSEMKIYHTSDFRDLYYKKVYCKYKIEKKHYSQYFDSFDFFLTFYKDNDIDIIDLYLIHELGLNNFREAVEIL